MTQSREARKDEPMGRTIEDEAREDEWIEANGWGDDDRGVVRGFDEYADKGVLLDHALQEAMKSQPGYEDAIDELMTDPAVPRSDEPREVRTVEAWREKIVEWLGPQRVSLYLGKDLHNMVLGAVMADAIRAAAIPSPSSEDGLLREAADAALTDFIYAHGSDFDASEWPGMAWLRSILAPEPPTDPTDAIREYRYEDEGLGGT